MNPRLIELAAALRERLEIIGDDEGRRDPLAHMARLQKVSERIEAIERGLPQEIDPQLRHYLQRRSYNKALDFIEASQPRSPQLPEV